MVVGGVGDEFPAFGSTEGKRDRRSFGSAYPKIAMRSRGPERVPLGMTERREGLRGPTLSPEGGEKGGATPILGGLVAETTLSLFRFAVVGFTLMDHSSMVTLGGPKMLLWRRSAGVLYPFRVQLTPK
jgi:hypothetical protein